MTALEAQLAGKNLDEHAEVRVLEEALLALGNDERDRPSAPGGEVAGSLVHRVAERLDRTVDTCHEGGPDVASPVEDPRDRPPRDAGKLGDVLDGGPVAPPRGVQGRREGPSSVGRQWGASADPRRARRHPTPARLCYRTPVGWERSQNGLAREAACLVRSHDLQQIENLNQGGKP